LYLEGKYLTPRYSLFAKHSLKRAPATAKKLKFVIYLGDSNKCTTNAVEKVSGKLTIMTVIIAVVYRLGEEQRSNSLAV